MNPDFGATSEDYAHHRAGFPDSLFERLSKFQIGEKGQLIVDLGTGTGSLARGLAKRDCVVIGIDHSNEMLKSARELDSNDGVQVEYRLGPAEDTGLPDSTYDIVTVGQCWHWFDRPRAAVEVKRILKPSGMVAIAHFDWLPLAGNMVRSTEELIESHNSDWRMGSGLGMYPQWLRDLGVGVSEPVPVLVEVCLPRKLKNLIRSLRNFWLNTSQKKSFRSLIACLR